MDKDGLMARTPQIPPEPTSREEVLERLRKDGFEVEPRKTEDLPDLVEVPGLAATDSDDEQEEPS